MLAAAECGAAAECVVWRKAYRPVSQPPNAFVMQGLDLLGGRARLAAQELEKQRCISQHNSN